MVRLTHKSSVYYISGALAALAVTVAYRSCSNRHSSRVTLSWKASSSSNVVGYNVYRREHAGAYTKLNVAPVEETSYADRTAQGGKAYFYVVTAVDNRGIQSEPCEEAAATVPP